MGKVSIDICGPFATAPLSKKYKIVMLDYNSRWPDIYTSEKLPTSSSIIGWLKSVFTRFGYPEDVTTDNGSQFTSKEFQDFLNENGIKHSKTVPYNPPANGLVERFNREIKAILQASRYDVKTYEDRIQSLLSMARTTVNRGTGKRPDEMFLGRKIRTKLSAPALLYMDKEADERRKKYQESYSEEGEAQLKVGDYAKFRKETGVFKGQPRWSLPYKVIERMGPSTFKLEQGFKVNARRLRKCEPPISVDFPENHGETNRDRNHPERPMEEALRQRPQRNRRCPDRYGDWV